MSMISYKELVDKYEDYLKSTEALARVKNISLFAVNDKIKHLMFISNRDRVKSVI